MKGEKEFELEEADRYFGAAVGYMCLEFKRKIFLEFSRDGSTVKLRSRIR